MQKQQIMHHEGMLELKTRLVNTNDKIGTVGKGDGMAFSF